MEKKSFECLIESALFTRSFISQYSITPNDLSLQHSLVLSRLGKKKAMACAKKKEFCKEICAIRSFYQNPKIGIDVQLSVYPSAKAKICL